MVSTHSAEHDYAISMQTFGDNLQAELADLSVDQLELHKSACMAVLASAINAEERELSDRVVPGSSKVIPGFAESLADGLSVHSVYAINPEALPKDFWNGLYRSLSRTTRTDRRYKATSKDFLHGIVTKDSRISIKPSPEELASAHAYLAILAIASSIEQ